MKRSAAKMHIITAILFFLYGAFVFETFPIYAAFSTSTGSIGVSADVPGGSSSGAAPLPTPTPTSEPTPSTSELSITKVVIAPTAGSATITWTLSKSASATLSYGKNATTYELGTITIPAVAGQTVYSATLKNLNHSTNYYYKLVVKEGEKSALSKDSFTTHALDTTAPIISDIVSEIISDTEAKINWSTNEPATTRVFLSTQSGGPYTKSQFDSSELGNTHHASFSKLMSGSLYYYVINAEDSSHNAATSSEKRFKLFDVIEPIVQTVKIENITKTSATVSLSADEPVTAEIIYTNVITSSTMQLLLNEFATSHTTFIDNLIPGTLYTVDIKIKDSAQNETIVTRTFETQKDTVPPPNVIDASLREFVLAPSETENKWQITVAWNVPLGSDIQGAMVRYSFVSSPKTPNNGQLFSKDITTPVAAVLTLSKSVQAPTVHISVFARDASGNYASGVLLSKKLSLPKPEVVDTIEPFPEETKPANKDTDNDGVSDAFDVFPNDPNEWKDSDGDGIGDVADLDADNDTISDIKDNCPQIANSDQSDSNNDGVGDACATSPVVFDDVDNDGISNEEDNCATLENGDQTDSNGNGVGDACDIADALNPDDVDADEVPNADDNCPTKPNPEQDDENQNGIGDACEIFYNDPEQDPDGDGIVNAIDNCPDVPNIDQMDFDGDWIGDACDIDTLSPLSIPDDGGVLPDDAAKKALDEEAAQNPTFTETVFDFFGIGDVEEDRAAGIENGIKVRVVARDLIFGTASNSIILSLQKNSVSLLSGFDLSILLPRRTQPVGKTIDQVSLLYGNQKYQMSSTDKNFYTSIFVKKGATSSTVTVIYSDGTTDVVRFTVHGVGYGVITGTTTIGKIPLEGARIELHNRYGAVVDMGTYGQKNPFTATSEGRFGFMVPNGRYSMKIIKDGYRTEETAPFDVKNNSINSTHALFALPSNIAEQVEYITQVSIHEAVKFVENPEVEETTKQVVAPTTVAIITANTAVATGSSLLTYLQFLFTQPLLLLSRRKRYGWGTVYNSLTKNPVDLAFVRLLNAKTRRVIQTKITDLQGRFSFFAPRGEYVIEVKKPSFVFPSTHIGQVKDDGRYMDIYHGAAFEIRDASAQITPNIPIDPMDKTSETGKKLLARYLLRKLQFMFSVSGMVIAAISLIIVPTLLTIVALCVHSVLFLGARIIAFPKKPKSWGVIFDAITKSPLHYAIARIFDKEYNKLLDTQITDNAGRYAFLASQRKYYVTYEKNHYEKKISEDIDLTTQKIPTAIVLNVGMKKIESSHVSSS